MITVQVFFAAFSLACFCPLAATDEVLSSVEYKFHEYYGKWGTMVTCLAGEYAYGFQLRVSYINGLDDGVGVDEMALVCGDKKRTYPQYIYSTEGRWGDWENVRECPDGEFLVGFRTRHMRPTHEHQDGLTPNDDKGVTDLQMFCSGGNTLDGNAYDDGDWMKEHRCKDDARICGISTYLMDHQGTKDDEGMTAVKMKCCDTAEKITDITIG